MKQKLKEATKKAANAVKSQGFLTGALTLAVAGILCRVIGIAFRIPLANIVGNYGMGVYQMVYPIYGLLLVISSAGVPVAISKMVAKTDDKTERRRILANSLFLLAIVGLAVSAIMIGVSYPIASLQGNPEATKIYFAIAPAIFIVCLISAFRGYFQGLANMIPTATSQIVEQIVKVAVGLALLFILIPYGVTWAVFGAILAVTISEVVALGFLIVLFLFHLRRDRKSSLNDEPIKKPAAAGEQGKIQPKTEPILKTPPLRKEANSKISVFRNLLSWSLMWEIIKKAVPITLMAALFPLILVFDSLVVIHFLQSGGASNEVATQLYGICSGTVHTLINMPAVLGIAIGTAVVPMTAALLKKKQMDAVAKKTFLAVKLSLLLGLFFVLFYIAFSKEIITLLYENAFDGNKEQLRTATILLKIEAIMILLMGLTQVFTSLLQGASRARYPLIALAIGGAAKIAFELAFIQTGLGIYAVSIGNVICFGIALIITMFFAFRFLEVKFKFSAKGWRIVTLVIGYCAVLVPLALFLPRGKFWVLLAGSIAFVVYAFGVWALRVFKKGELGDNLSTKKEAK